MGAIGKLLMFIKYINDRAHGKSTAISNIAKLKTVGLCFIFSIKDEASQAFTLVLFPVLLKLIGVHD
jgi:hypothetical protein